MPPVPLGKWGRVALAFREPLSLEEGIDRSWRGSETPEEHPTLNFKEAFSEEGTSAPRLEI